MLNRNPPSCFRFVQCSRSVEHSTAPHRLQPKIWKARPRQCCQNDPCSNFQHRMFQFLETKTSNTRLGHQFGRNGFGIAFYKISVFEGDPLYHYNMMIGKDSIFNLCFYMSRMQLRLGFNMSLSEGANCLATKGDWALKWCFPKLLQNDFRFSKVFQQPNPRPSRR